MAIQAIILKCVTSVSSVYSSCDFEVFFLDIDFFHRNISIELVVKSLNKSTIDFNRFYDIYFNDTIFQVTAENAHGLLISSALCHLTNNPELVTKQYTLDRYLKFFGKCLLFNYNVLSMRYTKHFIINF